MTARASGTAPQHAAAGPSGVRRWPAKASAHARGYGRAHRLERARWAPLVASGTVACWRCGKPIGARERWDLGHDDHDRSRYRGPEHPACNRATQEPGRTDPAPVITAWWA